ncbi:glycosyl hydrolase 53 family protein [Streptomyces sp. L7]
MDISSLPKDEAYGAVYRRADGRRDDPIRDPGRRGCHPRPTEGLGVNPADRLQQQAAHPPAGQAAAPRPGSASGSTSPLLRHMGGPVPPDQAGRLGGHLDVAGLTRAVYDHTADVLGALRRQGTPADLVQIGNEINGGLLWPTGKNWGDDAGGWGQAP